MKDNGKEVWLRGNGYTKIYGEQHLDIGKIDVWTLNGAFVPYSTMHWEVHNPSKWRPAVEALPHELPKMVFDPELLEIPGTIMMTDIYNGQPDERGIMRPKIIHDGDREDEYLACTMAMMVMHAIYEGYKTVHMFGMDFQEDRIEGKWERPCTEYWMGFGRAYGVRYTIPTEGSTIKTTGGIYGGDMYRKIYGTPECWLSRGMQPCTVQSIKEKA